MLQRAAVATNVVAVQTAADKLKYTPQQVTWSRNRDSELLRHGYCRGARGLGSRSPSVPCKHLERTVSNTVLNILVGDYAYMAYTLHCIAMLEILPKSPLVHTC